MADRWGYKPLVAAGNLPSLDELTSSSYIFNNY